MQQVIHVQLETSVVNRCSLKVDELNMIQLIIWIARMRISFINPNRPQSNKIQQGEVKKMR